MMEEKVTIEGDSTMEEKFTIEGECTREEMTTMERGTRMQNETKKGGLEDTDQKVVDGQKEEGWVLFDTVPEDDLSQLHCKESFPFSKYLHHLIWGCHTNSLPRLRSCSPSTYLVRITVEWSS